MRCSPSEDDESIETYALFEQTFADSEQLTAATYASNSMNIPLNKNDLTQIQNDEHRLLHRPVNLKIGPAPVET
jgi:hypothetical protein